MAGTVQSSRFNVQSWGRRRQGTALSLFPIRHSTFGIRHSKGDVAMGARGEGVAFAPRFSSPRPAPPRPRPVSPFRTPHSAFERVPLPARPSRGEGIRGPREGRSGAQASRRAGPFQAWGGHECKAALFAMVFIGKQRLAIYDRINLVRANQAKSSQTKL